jgi:hypothetical protein
MASTKIFLPLYNAWLKGCVTKCACTNSDNDLYDVGFTCLHHDALVFRDCFCDYSSAQQGIECQLCSYRQMGDLLKDAHDQLSAEEKATLVNSPSVFLDEGPTKLSTVALCMTALLLKREEMAQATPGEVDVREEDPVAKKIIDEVTALLSQSIVKSCNCVFKPIGKLIAHLDAEHFMEKDCGCKGT